MIPPMIFKLMLLLEAIYKPSIFDYFINLWVDVTVNEHIFPEGITRPEISLHFCVEVEYDWNIHFP